MTLYYIEKKTFYRDKDGFDRQLADGGELPILYHSFLKARAKAERMTQMEIDTYGQRVELNNANYPCKRGDLLYGTRLYNPERGYRTEIRIYKIETIV